MAGCRKSEEYSPSEMLLAAGLQETVGLQLAAFLRAVVALVGSQEDAFATSAKTGLRQWCIMGIQSFTFRPFGTHLGMHMRPTNTALVLIIILACCPATARVGAQQPLADFPELNAATDWPWWRGPNRNGVAASDCRPPVTFGPNENVKWKAAVPGRGHSSPIVVGKTVYLATADEAAQTHSVLAIDLESGQQKWKVDINRGGFPSKNHPKNTEASPTVASDGQRLFVTCYHHDQVQLTALGLDGNPVWQTKVAEFRPKKYEYGYAPSPLLYGKTVIVASEWDGPSFITALDRVSGQQVWQTPRPNSISFSSPVVANVAGREQLFISGLDRVSAYDPTNGRPLWEVAGTTAATCGTMIWNENMVFASGGYPKAETLAVFADGSGRVAWRNGQKCYEQSMILIDGHIYALTDIGVLVCWRAVDGAEMWRKRLQGPVSASPVYAGGHVYWANEAGTCYVFRPSPERFEGVAENRLGTESFASPAVVGNRLLLRVAESSDSGVRQEMLVCIGD